LTVLSIHRSTKKISRACANNLIFCTFGNCKSSFLIGFRHDAKA
jgi:hypothetical protein